MKNLITILIISLSIAATAQTKVFAPNGKVVILNSDRTWSYEGETEFNLYPKKGDKYFYAKNGFGEYVKVEVEHIAPEIPEEMIESMMREAISAGKNKCKNQSSYIPRSVFAYIDKDKITVAVSLNATNGYGALGDMQSYTLFSMDGTYIKSI